MASLTRTSIFPLLLFLTLTFVLNSQSSDCAYDQAFESAKINNPTFQKENLAYEKAYQQYMLSVGSRSYGTDEFLNLPIVFHIVHESVFLGSVENPRDEIIFQAVEQVNKLFRQTDTELEYQNPFYGVDSEISFCVASEAPDGTPALGIVRHAINEGEFFSTINILWDKERYINVIIQEDNTNCGAYRSGFDNIVIADRCFLSKNVLAHELGHYLSLRHTFISEGECDNQDCLSQGDFVCDTPPQDKSDAVTEGGFEGQPCLHPGNSCQSDEDDSSIQNPYRAVALGGLGDQPDANNNVMGYAGTCVSTFTAGQVARMKFNLTEERKNLRAFTGCGQDLVFDYDVSIDHLDVSQSDECGEQVEVSGELINYGSSDVDSVEIFLLGNNIEVVRLNWTGLIKLGERVPFSLKNVPIVFGSNHFEILAQNPNARPDANPSNNQNFIDYTHKNIELEIIGSGATVGANDQTLVQIGVNLFGNEDKFHFLWRRENGPIEQDQQGKPIILVSQAGKYFLEYFSEDYSCSWSEEIIVEERITTSRAPTIYSSEASINCRTGGVQLRKSGVTASNISWYSRSGLIQDGSTSLLVDSAGDYRIKATNHDNGEVSYSDWYAVVDIRDSISFDLAVDGAISCANKEVKIEALSSDTEFSEYTFIWKDLRDGERIISEGTEPNITVSQPGRYGLEMYKKGVPFPCKFHKEIEVLGSDEVPSVLIKMPEQLDFTNTDTIRLDASQSAQGDNFSYHWSSDHGEIIDGINTLNPLVRGYAKYMLELSSEGDCTQSSTLDLVPSHVINLHTFCGNFITATNSIYLIIEGRHGFPINAIWTFPNGEVYESNSLVTRDSGVYRVSYFNGIETIQDSVFVSQDLVGLPIAQIDALPVVNCRGREYTLTGKNSTYSNDDIFIWRNLNGSFIGDELELKTNGGGSYQLDVISSQSFCSTEDSHKVEYVPAGTVAMAGPDILEKCVQNTTLVGLNEDSDELQFRWYYVEENDSTFLGTTPSIRVEGAGKYSLELYDRSVNCFTYDAVEVAYLEDDISIASKRILNPCLDYNEVLFVENLERFFNYDIEWTLPNGETSTSFFLPAKQTGTYRVDYFSNTSNCTKSAFIDYTSIQGLDIEIESQDLSCFGANDGAITAIPVGGAPPYTWENEDYDQLDLSAALYTYILTDSAGCHINRDVIIHEPPILEVDQFIIDANELSVVISGGTEPYTYLWNTGSTQDQIQNPKFKEKYMVTVTDANGCTVAQEIEYLSLPNTDTIILMPNPALDQIQIFIQSGDPLEEIKIYNTLGVCVQTIQNYQSLDWIDISRFTSGIYLAVLSSESINQTIKFVKE